MTVHTHTNTQRKVRREGRGNSERGRGEKGDVKVGGARVEEARQRDACKKHAQATLTDCTRHATKSVGLNSFACIRGISKVQLVGMKDG